MIKIETYIYLLRCPKTNEVKYVGKANDPKSRYYSHMRNGRTEISHKRNWINSLKKEGLFPILDIIKKVSIENWKYWERYYIAYYKSKGHNLTNYKKGGNGLFMGNRTSFKKGQTPWNKGIIGYSTTKKGKLLSENIKMKISKTLKGRLNTGASKPIIQIDKINGIIIGEYPSAAEASRQTNILKSTILNNTSGRSKSAGGYIWKRKE